MADDKKPMQADGKSTEMHGVDENGELASRQGGREQGGESGGGPYPNPHHGEGSNDKSGDFKGGDSNQAYYGHGQLGEKDVEGENDNAPSSRD